MNAVYRPPNTDQDHFLMCFNKLNDIMDKNKCKDFVIGMDHNLDLLKHHLHTNTQVFLESMLDKFIMPCITRPTRITKETATLIDNICMSRELHTKQKSCILLSDLSDHLPCISIISNCKDLPKDMFKTKRNFTEKKLREIKIELDLINWKVEFSKQDVNENTKMFHDIVMNTIDKICPERTEKIPAKRVIGQPWLSKGLLKCSKNQFLLYKLALSTKSKTDQERYKQYRNVLKKVKRAS